MTTTPGKSSCLGLANALLLSFALPAAASTPAEIAKLLASDADGGDAFGRVVAVSGNTAVIGAPSDSDAGSSSGSAYVFTRTGTTWTEQAKLTASDAAAGDSFGSSVAINNGTVVVGAQADGDAGSGSGSAYVFTRTDSTWTEQAKLTASDAAADDQFGWSVAVVGNTAVIGALSDDDAGTNSGSAYVFTRIGTTWAEQAKLAASDGDEQDGFGLSLAITADTLLVGAFDEIATGSVYVFIRAGTSWTEQAKLTATDAAAGDNFGLSLAVSGDTAVIGAVTDDSAGADSGSAYMFTRTGTIWTEQAKLTASDGAAGDHFGFSVTIDGNTVVIGADLNDEAGSDSGSAYVFTRIGKDWTERAKLVASDANAVDRFGSSVAITGDMLLVGADHTGDAGTASGSVYVFSLVMDVNIDIKPGDRRNKFNPRSQGKLWVAVLSDTDTAFDPLQIRILSVRFGPGGARVIRHVVRDVNKDGLADLVFQFRTGDAEINCGADKASLRGRTFDRQKFRGFDSVRTVGCK